MAATATATDADVDVDQQPHSTVAKSAASCLHFFQQCVQRAASIHPRELSLVEDQLARFSVWTTNIRVFAPGRAALDHRLREAPDVQDAVIGLLDALAFRVQSCWNSLEPLSSGTTQESSQPLVEVDPKFRQSIQGIANEISLLHRFSNTIRRASKAAQNLKAADSFRIRNDEENDVEDFITKLFVNHIRDKFPGVSDNICQRLAETMVLRRKRILYRRSRYGDTPIRPQETPSQPLVTVPKVQLKIRAAGQPQVSEGPQAAGDASKSAIQSVAQSATTLAPSTFQKASAPSVVSVSKTVALSNHEELPFPPAPLASLKRKYNEIRRQREKIDKHNLDSPNSEGKPKSLSSAWKEKTEEIEETIKAVGEVTCPFCFYALPAGDVIDDNKWRLHVKNDLDAYVCLFEDCSLPHELYVHSSAWLKHMREHAMRWRCTSKSHGQFVCESRSDYLTHMKTAHKGKFSDAQLQALADRNGRVLGPLFRSCPLCGKEEVDSTMDNHIVGHLRFLALKSLPTYEDEGFDDEGSQKGGSSASRAQSRRSTVESELKRDSLVTLEDIGEVNGESWHAFLWDSPELRSKYAPYGGFHSYISRYHIPHSEEDSTNKASLGNASSSTKFPPPSDDEKFLFNHFADPSLKFFEGSLFNGVPDTERLEFEWGFIPNQHRASRSLEDDPIIRKFLIKYDHRISGKSSLGPNVLPVNSSGAPNETEELPTSAFNGFTFPPTHTRPPQSRPFSVSAPAMSNTNDIIYSPPSLFPEQDIFTSYDPEDYSIFASNDDESWFSLFPEDDTVANQESNPNYDYEYPLKFSPNHDIPLGVSLPGHDNIYENLFREDSIAPGLAAGDDPGSQNWWPSPPLPPVDIGQQTTSNGNESETINNEIIQISSQLSNVKWDMVDMKNLRLDATISDSLEVDHQYIPIKVTIHIPRGYPKTSAPEFQIKKTPEMTDRIYQGLNETIHNTTNHLLGQKSLGTVLTYLAAGIVSETGVKQSSNEDQWEADDEALRTRAPSTTSNEKAPHKPRKSIIRMDPDCAICHAPANLLCDCEAKALEIAVKQAESRIMSPMYNDIRAWVRSQTQNYVRESFSKDMQEHQETLAKNSSGQGSTSEVVEGQMPPIKEKINASWISAVQSFPETLEYFYGLVEVTLPSDDDPAVKDPPLRALSGSKKSSQQKHLQSQIGSDALESTKAKTSKQREAKKPKQEAKGYLPAQHEAPEKDIPTNM